MLEGYDFIVSVRNEVDTYKVNKDGWTPEDGPKPRKNEVGAFFKYGDGATVSSSSGASSLMP